jgi:hypothetical protein
MEPRQESPHPVCPSCPSCRAGTGRAFTVRLSQMERTIAFRCTFCEHVWEATDRDLDVPFVVGTSTAKRAW